jgi:hypothetical protein
MSLTSSFWNLQKCDYRQHGDGSTRRIVSVARFCLLRREEQIWLTSETVHSDRHRSVLHGNAGPSTRSLTIFLLW